MQKNSDNFSQQDIMRMASTPAGKKLIQTLQSSDPTALQKAMQAASQGNMDSAKQSLAPLLASEEVQKLLKALGG